MPAAAGTSATTLSTSSSFGIAGVSLHEKEPAGYHSGANRAGGGSILDEHAPASTSRANSARLLHGTDEGQRGERYRCTGAVPSLSAGRNTPAELGVSRLYFATVDWWRGSDS